MRGDLSEDFHYRSREEAFAGFVELSPEGEEWQAEKIAAKDLLSRLSSSKRDELIGYLRTGLVRAYSTHVYALCRLGEDKTFSNVAQVQSWLRFWRHNGGGESAFHGCFRIPAEFWKTAHAENSDWQGSTAPTFFELTLADWSIGKFGSFYEKFDEPAHPEEPENPWIEVIGQTVYFAVAFGKSDIEATFGKFGKVAARSSTIYDWESAFADVASQFYHHTEFENIDARGVQSQIIKMLRESFESRRLAVPSDDSLKPKAAKLLGALRAQKP